MQAKTKNILTNLAKIPLFLARHLLFSFLLVIFFVIILANLLFYKYYILNQEVPEEVKQEQFILKERNYNKLLKFWEEQTEKFQDADLKNYLNIFQAK